MIPIKQGRVTVSVSVSVCACVCMCVRVCVCEYRYISSGTELDKMKLGSQAITGYRNVPPIMISNAFSRIRSISFGMERMGWLQCHVCFCVLEGRGGQGYCNVSWGVATPFPQPTSHCIFHCIFCLSEWDKMKMYISSKGVVLNIRVKMYHWIS